MSVLKNKRSIADMEFFHTARQLREDITKLLLRDFGIRDKIRKIKTEENMEVTIIEEYPEWLIENLRSNILSILRSLMKHITIANSIFPINAIELQKRRIYQDYAIADCQDLHQELLFCADIFPVKLSKFLPFADKIEREIFLLKMWKKANSKIEKAMAKKEENKR